MKLLLYCTKAKPYLYHDKDYCFDTMNTIDLGYKTIEYTNQRVYDDETGKFLGWETFGNMFRDNSLNGKIVAECDFEVEEITLKFDDYEVWIESNTDENVILKKSYLDDVELYNYLGGGNGDRGYAIHIKNLHIFDEPKELSDYYNFGKGNSLKSITKAPQNMMYAVEMLGEPMYVENHFIGFDDIYEDFILISIRPKWLCKILNGEKTIDVRKKVLKVMLNNE